MIGGFWAFWIWFAVGLSLLCIGVIVVHGMILAELRHRVRRLESLLAPGSNPFMSQQAWLDREHNDRDDPGWMQQKGPGHG